MLVLITRFAMPFSRSYSEQYAIFFDSTATSFLGKDISVARTMLEDLRLIPATTVVGFARRVQAQAEARSSRRHQNPRDGRERLDWMITDGATGFSLAKHSMSYFELDSSSTLRGLPALVKPPSVIVFRDYGSVTQTRLVSRREDRSSWSEMIEEWNRMRGYANTNLEDSARSMGRSMRRRAEDDFVVAHGHLRNIHTFFWCAEGTSRRARGTPRPPASAAERPLHQTFASSSQDPAPSYQDPVPPYQETLPPDQLLSNDDSSDSAPPYEDPPSYE